jgi:hypothetical protein
LQSLKIDIFQIQKWFINKHKKKVGKILNFWKNNGNFCRCLELEFFNKIQQVFNGLMPQNARMIFELADF